MKGKIINSHKKKYDAPVLVLGSGITVLGTIRCLEAANIPAYCICEHRDLEAASRGYRRLPAKFGFVSGFSELPAFLERLPFKKAVLMPCSDPWTVAIGGLPRHLKNRLYTSQSELEVQRHFVDKRRFQRLLKRHSIPHPQTFSIESEEDLTRLLLKLSANEATHYFLKPRDSLSFSQHFKDKGFSLNSREDAAKKFCIAQKAGFDMLLQEYVPGLASNHYYVEGFVDKIGQMPCVFARQRLRMYPPRFGNSSIFMSVPAAKVAPAVKTIQTLLRAVGYRGIYSAEFKQDERDGVYKLIEVNARCWWYVEFLNRCGINIPEMAYRDALGLEVKKVKKYATGVRAVNAFLDIRAGIIEKRAKRLSFGQWVKSWIGASYTMLRFSDPLPAIVYFYHNFKKINRFFKKRN